MFSSNASQVSSDAVFIEDVMSTFLYTGNGATQTITNGIDLAGKGGLVWFKPRNTANNHNLIDSDRGLNKFLISNDTAANGTTGAGYGVASFNSDGFSLAPPWTSSTNTTDTTYASWTFRKQPKFFDVVTYTTVSGAMTIPHNLGSVPGCWIIKATNAADSWWVHHRSIPTGLLRLEGTSASESSFSTATATTINIVNGVFAAGTQIVIYLFAHDAGGFGESGEDNVVSCGSVSASGVTAVTLGYEPQWLLMKRTDSTAGWFLTDTMRGWSMTSWPFVQPNTSGPEYTGITGNPTATGFTFDSASISGTGTYIYIAIRRGPMKVPTDGTTVFTPLARTGTNAAATITGIGFPPDLVIGKVRDATFRPAFMDRLRGTSVALQSSVTDAEVGTTVAVTAFGQNGVSVGADSDIAFINYLTNQYASWFFRRAPSFFDEVCYTGQQGVLADVRHNLGVIPELYILKTRSNARSWLVAGSLLGQNGLTLNASSASFFQLETFPSFDTASTIRIDPYSNYNVTGQTQVVYLFATCAGVSKVGSYTGTGTTQAINCGFTAGARFVLIKRTDAVGDWYVWDSARGIVANSDPYLLLNSTAAEVTGTDYIDPVSSGFEISSTAPAAINASGGSYIFLAVA